MGDNLINRDIAIPLHYQVRFIISSRIKSGEYPLGSRIPNELELSKELQVSRPTVRKALNELEELGMVERIRPKGTFVSRVMKKSWFEDMPAALELEPVLHQQEQSIQIALEESITDLFLINCFEEFTSLYRCKVELVHWNNWYDAIENIINKFVEKKVPDIFSVSNDAVGIFARMGVIQPLDGFLEPELLALLKARCAKYGMSAYLYNDHLYGCPLFSESRLLIYRKDHFRNSGIPDPAQHPLTHDSFITVGEQLSNPDKGLYAFAYPTTHEPQTLQSIMPWIIQRGGGMFRIDNGRVMPATEEPAFTEALQWYVDLTLKHRICPPVPPPLSARDITSMLVKGQISMMTAPPGILKWLMESTAGGEERYGFAPFPKGPVNSFTFMGGMPLCISSNCRNPQMAWELISFITQFETLSAYCKRTGALLPIERYDSKIIQENTAPYMREAARALENAVPHTYPVGYNQSLDFMRTGYWQTPIPQVLDLMLRGELSVQNAAKFLSMSIRSYSKQYDF